MAQSVTDTGDADPRNDMSQRHSLTLSPRLELLRNWDYSSVTRLKCSGAVMAHCNLPIPGSIDPPMQPPDWVGLQTGM
ncbi:hypothetical protein AAY473_032027 [Plecturocebus cupreus]